MLIIYKSIMFYNKNTIKFFAVNIFVAGLMGISPFYTWWRCDEQRRFRFLIIATGLLGLAYQVYCINNENYNLMLW